MVTKSKLTEAPSATDRTDAETTLKEILAAGELAAASLAQDGIKAADGDAAGVGVRSAEALAASGELTGNSAVSVPERQDFTREERIKFLMDRAAKQRARGVRALARDIDSGVVALERKILINDKNIGSSIERFLAVIDTAAYLVGRRGEMVLGAQQTNTIQSKLSDMAAKMVKDSNAELRAASELTRIAKEKDVFQDEASQDQIEAEWLEPQYQHPAFSMTVQLKNPVSVHVVTAMSNYDKAIHLMTTLQWNLKASQDQVDHIRSVERRASMAIHVFAARALTGLRRRVAPVGDSTGNAAAQSSAAAVDANANQGSDQQSQGSGMLMAVAA